MRTWSRQYEASKTGELASMDRVMEWLPRNIPQQTKVAIDCSHSPLTPGLSCAR